MVRMQQFCPLVMPEVSLMNGNRVTPVTAVTCVCIYTPLLPPVTALLRLLRLRVLLQAETLTRVYRESFRILTSCCVSASCWVIHRPLVVRGCRHERRSWKSRPTEVKWWSSKNLGARE